MLQARVNASVSRPGSERKEQEKMGKRTQSHQELLGIQTIKLPLLRIRMGSGWGPQESVSFVFVFGSFCF